jgi:hypothetical protein
MTEGERPPHEHRHGPRCGHYAVLHDGHPDFLHEGQLHHETEGELENHHIQVDPLHPVRCTPDHSCGGHSHRHRHAADCGHPQVPHDGHMDHWVEGHLHHPHQDHCDAHGKLPAASAA